jgi:iron-sulfur cluster repair protein YtfE (RIC family)
MSDASLQSAHEREHHEIDEGIEDFVARLAAGEVRPAPLLPALEALRRHIYLEEEILFPPIAEGGMTMPVFVMMREHAELWRSMDALVALLDEDADAARLQEACRGLLGQLERHNGKEEPIIYPLADSSLSAPAAAELARFIGEGATPEGWVCRQARDDASGGGRGAASL